MLIWLRKRSSGEGLPSHEGSGLKLTVGEIRIVFKGLPSHEGSGLKSITPFRWLSGDESPLA